MERRVVATRAAGDWGWMTGREVVQARVRRDWIESRRGSGHLFMWKRGGGGG